MTYLDCSVTGCFYNAEGCCNKGDITVEGREATDNGGTSCGSFRERRSDAGYDTMQRVSKEAEVACEARHCIYNNEYKCDANHIGIAGGNACAQGETECASFRCD